MRLTVQVVRAVVAVVVSSTMPAPPHNPVSHRLLAVVEPITIADFPVVQDRAREVAQVAQVVAVI
jgi:hypothetical protein